MKKLVFIYTFICRGIASTIYGWSAVKERERFPFVAELDSFHDTFRWWEPLVLLPVGWCVYMTIAFRESFLILLPFFCRLQQFEFLFISQAVRLSLLFTPRYADEDVKLIPNASRDFLPNDFYGIVKISFGFLCSSRSLNIKSRAEWWKHKLCCSTHTNGFCEPWMDVCTAKKGVHSTKSASISFQSLLIH